MVIKTRSFHALYIEHAKHDSYDLVKSCFYIYQAILNVNLYRPSSSELSKSIGNSAVCIMHVLRIHSPSTFVFIPSMSFQTGFPCSNVCHINYVSCNYILKLWLPAYYEESKITHTWQHNNYGLRRLKETLKFWKKFQNKNYYIVFRVLLSSSIA